MDRPSGFSVARLANGLLVAAFLSGCVQGAMESREGFCEVVTDVLRDDSIGDSPERMKAQMEAVQDAAARLEEADSGDLLVQIEQLIETLELAEEGQAPAGWSSVEVVHEVEELCPQVSGLMPWIVQP